jgi:putative SOS response-associated peptidase YedK
LEWRAEPGPAVIRRNHKTGEVSLDPLRWGSPNARPFTVLPTFRDAYRRRSWILLVDVFLEWKAIKRQRAKQPCAIAMKDGSPFGIGGRLENWKDPLYMEALTWNRITKLPVAMLAGVALGTFVVQSLHAQAKPPIFVVAEIDVSNLDACLKEYVPLA